MYRWENGLKFLLRPTKRFEFAVSFCVVNAPFGVHPEHNFPVALFSCDFKPSVPLLHSEHRAVRGAYIAAVSEVH